MITDALAGRRVLVTGVTGFVGQAVLERLLADLPDTSVVVLVRPRGDADGEARVRHLLTQPVFSSWRERVGDDGVEAALRDRLQVCEGDLGEGPPQLPADLDVVVHCASTVSFDPPIDAGFRTNLLGTVHLYEALRAAGARPHVVHVSTAYVAGVSRGVVREEPLGHDVDWHTELDAALHARTQAERESRRPEVLERLVADARAEHAKAGPTGAAADAEQRRRDAVEDRLVRAGRARARSLGWPDVYTLTKALAERAAEEQAAESGLALSVVRPSIIESALRHPYPGWIDGFKMAEPLILAYGRGVLPEFPGIPDGTIDVVPVDLVANALLAVAATPPEAGAPAYFHVGSGGRNPLPFQRLYGLVREYFRAHPLPDPERGGEDVRVPVWDFPGGHTVERRLRLGERAVEAADRALERLPRSSHTRDLASKVHKRRRQVEFLRRYADLYGPYAETEVVYDDRRALALHESLPSEERARFGFDAAVVDWHHYLVEVHCPSVTAVMRGVPPKARRANPVPGASERALAVFDLEGTVLASNVLESYLTLRLADLPRHAWPREVASLARSLPRYLAAERRDRGEFLRAFLRRYEGVSLDALRALVAEHADTLLVRTALPEAVRRVRHHRALGHRTVLVTGALDVLVEPLRPLFDEIVAGHLDVVDGRVTGHLARPPLVGEARAAWLREYADGSDADLGASWAYGDSHSDLPLLATVGNPVAVNPDTALFRAARRRRWPVEEWATAPGAPRLPLPAGAR
jgi:alcohol-forming fatty acyl-CoA reductase